MYTLAVTTSPTLSLKECIRRFTPVWHAVIMGTGAIANLFNVFPYGSQTHRGFQIISLAFLIFNTLLFLLFTSLTLARYILFPELWPTMLRHPTQSLFISCFPMGFATILISAANVVYGYFGIGGKAFVYALWAMWWVDVGAAAVICFGQLYFMFTRQTHSLSRMTLVWLLPIVTPIVVSAAGGVIAQALLSLQTTATPTSPSSSTLSHIYLTLATCTILVTIGILLSLSIIPIYILRLMIYKVPTRNAVFTAFLPLGPLGQSGYTYVVLGEIAHQVFPVPSSTPTTGGTGDLFANPYTGHVLYVLGWAIGFFFWSFATCWVILGILTLIDILIIRKDPKTPLPPFKVTFWGMIFPNGVYANLTIHLSHSTSPSQILRIWGSIYAILTLSLWLYAFTRTLATLRGGSVFEDLALAAEAEEQEQGRGRGRVGEMEMEENTEVVTWREQGRGRRQILTTLGR